MSPIQSQKVGFRLLEILFGGFLVLGSMFLAKDIESTIFPVVDNFQIVSAQPVEGGIEIKGTMTKVRQCTFKDFMVYVKTDNSKLPVAASYKFNDPSSSLETRATISQAWGPWTIFIPGEYEVADFDFYSRHSCHSFYETHTHLHSFSVEQTNDALTIIKQQEH